MKFAIEVRNLLNSIPKTVFNSNDFVQLLRSSGSVGANYIEANECFSKKDFIYRIKICLKEAKESRYWLLVINRTNDLNKTPINELIDEATQLIRIFYSMLK
jgi:four helix bundle protein